MRQNILIICVSVVFLITLGETVHADGLSPAADPMLATDFDMILSQSDPETLIITFEKPDPIETAFMAADTPSDGPSETGVFDSLTTTSVGEINSSPTRSHSTSFAQGEVLGNAAQDQGVVVPEPSTLWLVGLGVLGALWAVIRRRKRS